MGALVRGLALVLVVSLTACSSAPEKAEKPAAGQDKSCALVTGGREVLRLTPPAGAKCQGADGSLTVSDAAGHLWFFLWTVNGAQSVQEAAGRVGDVIKGEFKDFKPTRTQEVTLAGVPARQITGSGSEADDGDPGNAEVLVFKMGQHVFVACIHGEGDISAPAHRFMMAALQTARVP